MPSTKNTNPATKSSFFILESYHTPAGRGKQDFLSSLSFLALTKNEPGDATSEPHHEQERNARLISEQKAIHSNGFALVSFRITTAAISAIPAKSSSMM